MKHHPAPNVHHRKVGGPLEHPSGHHPTARARGGKVDGREHMKVSGNPDVFKEAEEKKRGGKVHKKHHRASGGKVLGAMGGAQAKPRLDRPGRKSGGRVGADKAPLSSAHKGTGGGGMTPRSEDSYGGCPSD